MLTSAKDAHKLTNTYFMHFILQILYGILLRVMTSNNSHKYYTVESIIRGFSKCFAIMAIWQTLYVMVRRLPNRFIGGCSCYLGCLCVVYWFVNIFSHQNLNDFVVKNSKICIYRFIWQTFNHHIQLWQFGKMSFRKN